MKLALYLPNFRDKVTVSELEQLTSLAEDLGFDSVWTLDRIVVPEASDREELQYSFGMMDEFPKALPVSSHGVWYQGWPLIPWLAAETTKVRIGIQDTPDELQEWRTAIQRELAELGSSRSIGNLEICSMIWFTITDEQTDQTPQGKASDPMAGTAAQITDNLKRYREAGLTTPLLWPPFQDVPVSKALDDLKRLREEIMPRVEAV